MKASFWNKEYVRCGVKSLLLAWIRMVFQGKLAGLTAIPIYSHNVQRITVYLGA